MRKLFGALAILLGALSITITARYGYKGADTEIDGVIAAAMFGTISLCAFIFDGAAVRLWFTGYRKVSVFVGLIAAAALVVTFGNSLGGIVSRGDKTLAERQKVSDSQADDRGTLTRLTREREAMGAVAAVDEEAVKAAKRAADTATSNRIAECGAKNETRGPKCSRREQDEQDAATRLATVSASKATSDRAAKLDAEIETVRLRLADGAPVHAVNPLGNALSVMLGAAAAAVTAWQAAIIAAVFELCLVCVMVIFEVLGHSAAVAPRIRDIEEEAVEIIPPARAKPRLVASGQAGAGSVPDIMADVLEPAKGQRVEIEDGYRVYVATCKRLDRRVVTPEQFIEAMQKFCLECRIKTEICDGKIYLVGVQIAGTKARPRRRLGHMGILAPPAPESA
jgi:hypothetical protein